MDGYALDNAAAAALWAIQNAPREHIGLLYEQDGTIHATPTQTRNNAGRTKGSFEIPAGSLRGIFHNHPPLKQQRRGSMLDVDVERTSFSPDDLKQAKRLGVPSYIAVGNKLRRYDPATGRTEDVLAEIPIDVIRALYITDGLPR